MVREDSIKSTIKIINCRGLHSTLQLPITNSQSPVIYQNKVREDIIKLFMKAVNCRGLHSTLQVIGQRSKVKGENIIHNAQCPMPNYQLPITHQ